MVTWDDIAHMFSEWTSQTIPLGVGCKLIAWGEINDKDREKLHSLLVELRKINGVEFFGRYIYGKEQETK